jgi:hypothetical protein
LRVLVAAPIYRAGSYALDKYLRNQKQIQQTQDSCELLLATTEPDFVEDLQKLIADNGIKGNVIYYAVEKPEYSKSREWNITCGREAIRRYFLENTDADELLFLDADMTFDPQVVEVLNRQIYHCDAIINGNALLDLKRQHSGVSLSGFGCVLFPRKTLQHIYFRCYEFKNGDTISADEIFEMSMFESHMRINKGLFIDSFHYKNSFDAVHTPPQRVTMIMKIKNYPPIRFFLIRASIVTQRNIPWRLRQVLKRD